MASDLVAARPVASLMRARVTEVFVIPGVVTLTGASEELPDSLILATNRARSPWGVFVSKLGGSTEQRGDCSSVDQKISAGYKR